jgi:predicted enzyme related to lactoylglutathione lyase
MATAERVSHIPFRCWDRDAAFAFFTEALGFEPHLRGPITYVRLGEQLVELLPGEQPDNLESAPYIFGVEVGDLDEAIERVGQHGSGLLRPISTPTSFWGRQAVIGVPGGPPIALREYETPDGPTFTEWRPRS